MNPTLGNNVRIVRSGSGRYVLSEPESGFYYEVSDRERYLLHLMNGEHSVDDMARLFLERFGSAISPSSLDQFLRQLETEGLLGAPPTKGDHFPPPNAAGYPLPEALPVQVQRSTRVNRVFDVLTELFGWLVSWQAAIPCLFLFGIAFLGLAQNWSHIPGEIFKVIHQLPVPLVVVCFLVQILYLDLPKAVMTGIVCRKFGGEISRFGFRIQRGFIPTLTCEMAGNSLVRMDSTAIRTMLGIRLWTVATLTSLAVIYFMMIEAGTGLRSFFAIAAVVGFFELFILLNVFFPYDGCMLLAYVLKIPRLFDRSYDELKAWICFRPSPEGLPPGTRFGFLAYGLVSFLLILVVSVVLAYFVSHWLTNRYGALGAIAVLALGYQVLHRHVAAYFRPVTQALASLLRRFPPTRRLIELGRIPRYRRGYQLGAVVLVVLAGFIPYSFEVGGDCRLVPEAHQAIRSQLADEITAIHYREGDWVKAGDVVAELSGREISAEVNGLEAQLAEAQAGLDLLVKGARSTEVQIARDNVALRQADYELANSELARARSLAGKGVLSVSEQEKAASQRATAYEELSIARGQLQLVLQAVRPEDIRAQLATIEGIRASLAAARQYEELTRIRSPISGRLVTPQLEARLGQRAESGALIAVVQDPAQLLVEIDSGEVAARLLRVGLPVKVRLNATNGDLLKGKVIDFAPVASNSRVFDTEPFRTDREASIRNSLRLGETDTTIRVSAQLDPDSPALVPGATGYARITVADGNFWSALLPHIFRFLKVTVWSYLP